MNNVIDIDPFWDKLQEYHRDHNPADADFWDWLKKEYGAYQVYVKSNPTALGEREACGLWFGTAEEVTFFTLRWS